MPCRLCANGSLAALLDNGDIEDADDYRLCCDECAGADHGRLPRRSRWAVRSVLRRSPLSPGIQPDKGVAHRARPSGGSSAGFGPEKEHGGPPPAPPGEKMVLAALEHAVVQPLSCRPPILGGSAGVAAKHTSASANQCIYTDQHVLRRLAPPWCTRPFAPRPRCRNTTSTSVKPSKTGTFRLHQRNQVCYNSRTGRAFRPAQKRARGGANRPDPRPRDQDSEACLLYPIRACLSTPCPAPRHLPASVKHRQIRLYSHSTARPRATRMGGQANPRRAHHARYSCYVTASGHPACSCPDHQHRNGVQAPRPLRACGLLSFADPAAAPKRKRTQKQGPPARRPSFRAEGGGRMKRSHDTQYMRSRLADRLRKLHKLNDDWAYAAVIDAIDLALS